jgi:hypothetical protein
MKEYQQQDIPSPKDALFSLLIPARDTDKHEQISADSAHLDIIESCESKVILDRDCLYRNHGAKLLSPRGQTDARTRNVKATD